MGFVEEVRAIVTSIEYISPPQGLCRVTYTSLDGSACRVDEVAPRNIPSLGAEFAFADDGSGGQLLGTPRAVPPTEEAFALWIARHLGREHFEQEPSAVKVLVREAFFAGRASR
jgi:hypothetical protein